MGYQIVRLSELNEKHINQAVILFVEGFYNMFKGITRDKSILQELFKDSFDFQMVYVYLQNDCVVGFLGLGNSQKRAITLKKETCRKLFGAFKGTMIYKQMGSMLEKITVQNENEGYIDYITTDAQFRGMGIGTRLLQYVCNNLPYEYYILEVLLKNMNAIKLYEKLGFNRIKTTTNIMFMLNGFGKSIIMRLEVK